MIVFAHLLNDRSGSPRVLRGLIDGLAPREACILFVGSDGEGLLSGVDAPVRRYWYRRTGNKLLTLLTYFLSQGALFLALLRSRLPKNAVIYINTLLPFGAAAFGRLTGRRVIYHVHEVSLSPRPFRWLLTTLARITADRLIYVSDAHRALLPISPRKAVTVHNCVDPALRERGHKHVYQPRPGGGFVVLMLATPAAYKGLGEFARLARTLAHRPDIQFRLVMGRTDDGWAFPPNVTVLPPTDDPASCYEAASLVVNLSRPDLCVETFGLTLLEGMAFGIPVIAPPVGGPAELVADGREGFLVDSRDGHALAASVEALADDPVLCLAMSEAARRRASQFGRDVFLEAIEGAIRPLCGEGRAFASGGEAAGDARQY